MIFESLENSFIPDKREETKEETAEKVNKNEKIPSRQTTPEIKNSTESSAKNIPAKSEKLSQLEKIKRKLGIGENKTSQEKISANPENIAKLLNQISSEYKKFLIKEHQPTNWANDPYHRLKMEYPFVCYDSSLVLGNMLADIFGLEIGGNSPNRVDLIKGQYREEGEYEDTNHWWLKVSIDNKSFYVDAVLPQQFAYLQAAREMYKIFENREEMSAKKRMKESMKFLIKTIEELPDEIIFKPYDEAMKEFYKLYGLEEERDKEKIIRNEHFVKCSPITQKTIEDFKKLEPSIKKILLKNN